MSNFMYSTISRDAKSLRIAVTDIYDELSLERIRIENGCKVVPEERTETEIRQMIRERTQRDAESGIAALEAAKAAGSRSNTWESEPVINLVDSLIEDALEKGATDIHLEPSEGALNVRFRIDGMLETYRELPAWLSEPVIIRLKLLAKADITERRLPHDGSFSFQGLRENANIRLSTLPIQGGEKCVLRLLPTEDRGQTLDTLGFTPEVLREFRRIFSMPQGLFLITGPTGSGKTTTLYAGLREILRRQVNVTTIEDPVEYPLKGANQVQVNEKCGFTFARAMRSILRQDPDVILVGEIRDEETARIAIRAAQTGHLVLSTLHTNSAKAAAGRLLDLGISRAVLDDCLLGVAAQRLLRKVTQDGNYSGRVAAVEIYTPEGGYVQGSLQEYARTLVSAGITDMREVERVIG
ncbi:GspE/PulE family protein [Fibrobacter sp. UWR2]|uniref:GspE/PulE family protein n=1 Tax=Fibrobacter sp. UWR2 TaxID=1964352 RepID=UPI000B523C96|nr:GspE/PulE family protein [Fibrobacter sp. UWR2]OWU99013.1 secretion system protein E [Fibrobacter sp. UWR2]